MDFAILKPLIGISKLIITTRAQTMIVKGLHLFRPYQVLVITFIQLNVTHSHMFPCLLNENDTIMFCVKRYKIVILFMLKWKCFLKSKS